MAAGSRQQGIPIQLNQETPTDWQLMGTRSATAGYSSLGLPPERPEQERVALTQLVGQILRDPLLQSKLCDRIYELMRNDLQHQRERQQNYGSRY